MDISYDAYQCSFSVFNFICKTITFSDYDYLVLSLGLASNTITSDIVNPQ